MKKVVIYNTPMDPGNRKKTNDRNHNISNISKIDDKVYIHFIRSPRCLKGVPIDDHPDSCSTGCPHDECHLRIHDKRRYLVETASNPTYNILISRAELVWNYFNNVSFVLRTGKIFGLEMHHINADPIDDRFENLAFRDDHRKLEARLSSIRAHIERAQRIFSETRSEDTRLLLSNLKNMLKRESNVKDSPVVEYIIRQQIINLISRGYIRR
jgi:hypothetical protein